MRTSSPGRSARGPARDAASAPITPAGPLTAAQTALDAAAAWLLAGRLRTELLRRVPLLGTERLASEPEWRRAYLILSLLSHMYIWAGGDAHVVTVLPAVLARPWCETAQHLGLPPVLTHAAVVLWNWRLIDAGGAICTDNLAVLHVMVGGLDEAWFYLVTVELEAYGGRALRHITDALEAACRGGQDAVAVVTQSLEGLRGVVQDMTRCLDRMREHCDPHVFFTKVRPFLAGWKGSTAMPNGLIYEGVDPKPKFYSGGSAAESCLVQVIDAALGIKHDATHVAAPEPGSHAHTAAVPTADTEQNFLRQMRNYMPRSHRDYAAALEAVPSLREYVSGFDSHDLQVAFNDCVAAVREFRDHHIRIVAQYIVAQAAKQPQGSLSVRGTGGTGLMPFLKQVRDEVAAAELPAADAKPDSA